MRFDNLLDDLVEFRLAIFKPDLGVNQRIQFTVRGLRRKVMPIESLFMEADKLNDRFVSHCNLLDNLIKLREPILIGYLRIGKLRLFFRHRLQYSLDFFGSHVGILLIIRRPRMSDPGM